MPQGQSSQVVFKRSIQNQPELLPPSLEELIPERHAVRVVNEAVGEALPVTTDDRSGIGVRPDQTQSGLDKPV